MKVHGPERGRGCWAAEGREGAGALGPHPRQGSRGVGHAGARGPKAPTPLRRPRAGGAGAGAGAGPGPGAGRGRAGGWAGVPGAGAGPGWRCAAAGRPPRMRGSHGCSRRRCHSREHEGPNPGAPYGESGPRAPPLAARRSPPAPRAPAAARPASAVTRQQLLRPRPGGRERCGARDPDPPPGPAPRTCSGSRARVSSAPWAGGLAAGARGPG